MKVFVWSFIVVVVFVMIFGASIFNKLIRARNQAKNGFAQIDVQLKRRHDLIPNLVETTRRYLSHEEETLIRVISARNHAQSLQDSSKHQPDSLEHMALFAKAESMLSKALGQFSAVVEAYPELKADSMIKELMDELTNTENRIGFARQHYNDSVMFYNNDREVFPNNLISTTFGFRPLSPLVFEDRNVIAQAPVVNMG
ncbi:LemA family protein [Psychrobacter cryohalolentis]|uniref:LemA n=1 Tax=Psychrobacter cryohalolentis (strain ATCC BAA-1226 / DSM 17306 / VKM B-2378 / K5) TaxID=335284 RepID=Q1QAT7_PSYCK|nr:LemA family protein [Psychrobacter cryohalolentis]ABE75216.1 LemA [Psychrobacter cryohalolentis K5]ASE25411.1 LemA family protein [Psychrobacter cryohalolentis]